MAPKQQITIEYLRELADENGFICESKVYRGAQKKHHFRCKKNEEHLWIVNHGSIKKGCPDCRKKEQKSKGLQKFRNFMKEKKLSFQEKDFVDIATKIWVTCDKKHRWHVSPNSLYNGSGCPTCGLPNKWKNKTQIVI